MNYGKIKLMADSWLPLSILLFVIDDDIREKVFDPVPCFAAACINLCWFIMTRHHTFTQLMLQFIFGSLPGLMLGLLAHLTGRWIGEGDCMLLIFAGMFKGWKFVLSMLFFSFTGIFIAAVVMMIIKRFHRRMTIPMVPFLAAGYIFAQCYMYGLC